METKEEQSREITMQPWGKVLDPPQGEQIFELFGRYWNAHQVGYAAHKQADSRPVGTGGLMMLTSTYLTTNQSEECPWADHALFEQLL